MLAQLNQISGVQGSFANSSGTLVQLALQPGADPGRVILEASRALQAQVGDRIAVPLAGKEAAAALRTEEWRERTALAKDSDAGGGSATAKGSGGVAPVAAALVPGANRTARGLWLVLLVVLGLAAALGLVLRRRVSMRSRLDRASAAR